MVFVIHTISYICDSMRVRDRKGIVSSTNMSFVGARLSMKGRILFLLGCGTHFIEDNTKQYSPVVIIYDNTLHPMFTPDPCDYSRGLAVFCFFLVPSI